MTRCYRHKFKVLITSCHSSSALQPKLDERRDVFQQRRDYLLPALRGLGFDITGEPQGAFYLYARSESLAKDSMEFTHELLERAGVAITPGVDFGHNQPHEHVRFSYTTGMEQLQVGVTAIQQHLGR